MSVYTIKHNYFWTILYSLIIIGSIILLYPLWIPLGLIGSLLFLYSTYKFFLRFPLEVTLNESEITVFYLQNFLNINTKKVAIKDIDWVEVKYSSGRGGAIMLKIFGTIK